MTRVAPAEYDLIIRRDDANVDAVLSYLAEKKDIVFSNAINGAYIALKERNQKDYEMHVTTLENLVKSNPKLADDIHRYVQTLK